MTSNEDLAEPTLTLILRRMARKNKEEGLSMEGASNNIHPLREGGTDPAVPRAPGAPAGPAQPDTPTRQFAAPARAGFRRFRHKLVLLSFLLVVVLPSGGAGAYLWKRAADQYVSRLGFTVQREEPSAGADLLGGLSSLSGNSSSDTDLLFEFIHSQELVAELDRRVDLRSIWGRASEDVVFGLAPEVPIEDLAEYWRRMVRVGHGSGAGLLNIEVRAFNPVEARRIAQALLTASSEMINRLSAIAREDAIGYARDELGRAEDRLKGARTRLTAFRNAHQLISPEMELQSQAGILGTLHEQQAQVMIEIDLLRGMIRGNSDPRLRQAQRRLSVIEDRIRAEREKLGAREGGQEAQAYADIVGEFEKLMAERDFAERAYAATLANYDAAVAEARRKSRYLAAYMEPTFAQSAEYPRRIMLLLMTVGTLFLLWAIGALAGYSIKDRR
ncbi:hypothetical protein [Thioclava atlantica]|uniref:Capsule polysaccharide export protein n=1 Tax=Thioclava atlantica TaxID=1317124 RepID=A0A085TRW2_9RHOB|nr:hypothetical protein [Thioclava atlantica]KFE33459.1 capsule polysaccharide export protein [Thioclava atlantica]